MSRSRTLANSVDGKSPTELFTGEPHSHWLELLGFDLFLRQAASES